MSLRKPPPSGLPPDEGPMCIKCGENKQGGLISCPDLCEPCHGLRLAGKVFATPWNSISLSKPPSSGLPPDERPKCTLWRVGDQGGLPSRPTWCTSCESRDRVGSVLETNKYRAPEGYRMMRDRDRISTWESAKKEAEQREKGKRDKKKEDRQGGQGRRPGGGSGSETTA